VLQVLVADYATITPEDIWTDGLRVKAPRAKNFRAVKAINPKRRLTKTMTMSGADNDLYTAYPVLILRACNEAYLLSYTIIHPQTQAHHIGLGFETAIHRVSGASSHVLALYSIDLPDHDY
jgi:hypothetical protein